MRKILLIGDPMIDEYYLCQERTRVADAVPADGGVPVLTLNNDESSRHRRPGGVANVATSLGFASSPGMNYRPEQTHLFCLDGAGEPLKEMLLEDERNVMRLHTVPVPNASLPIKRRIYEFDSHADRYLMRCRFDIEGEATNHWLSSGHEGYLYRHGLRLLGRLNRESRKGGQVVQVFVDYRKGLLRPGFVSRIEPIMRPAAFIIDSKKPSEICRCLPMWHLAIRDRLLDPKEAALDVPQHYVFKLNFDEYFEALAELGAANVAGYQLDNPASVVTEENLLKLVQSWISLGSFLARELEPDLEGLSIPDEKIAENMLLSVIVTAGKHGAFLLTTHNGWHFEHFESPLKDPHTIVGAGDVVTSAIAVWMATAPWEAPMRDAVADSLDWLKDSFDYVPPAGHRLLPDTVGWQSVCPREEPAHGNGTPTTGDDLGGV